MHKSDGMDGVDGWGERESRRDEEKSEWSKLVKLEWATQA